MSGHIPVLDLMAQYATLSFNISGAKHEAYSSDNLFSATQAQSNIRGSWSGNKGSNSTYGSYNNQFTTIVLPSGTDPGVRSQRGAFGAGEAGIIKIPGDIWPRANMRPQPK